MKTSNPQIVRWFASLAECDFDIVHKKGEQMAHVDALSRAPVEAPSGAEGPTMYSISVREDGILLYQRVDEGLERKIKILKKNMYDRDRREKGEVKGYALRNGLLCKCDEGSGRELYLIPPAMRKAMVIKYHDLAGHFSVEKTLA